MPRVLLTPRAEIDLIDALVYLRRHSDRAADRPEAEFERECDLLARFPEMGAARDDLALGGRSAKVERYLILDRPIADGVEVLRFVHGSRDLPALFED